jgi:hypothetical protein
MRQSERARWFSAYSDLRSLLDDVLEAHAIERSEWVDERQRMLDAILAGNTGDFLARQNAGKSRQLPLIDPPDGPAEPKPRVLGF